MAQGLKKYVFLGLVCVANFLYSSESEYKNLLQTYEQLEQKNFAAWYNIGVLYKELGEEGKAVSAFVRAQKQAGLRQFYKAAQPIFQMGVAIPETYASGFYFYVYSIPLYFYQYVFLALLFLFFLLWYGMRRYAVKKIYVYIIFGIMTIIYGLYSMKYDWVYSLHAIIIDQQVNCFAGPDKSFLVIDHVQTPKMYKIYKEQNEFCLIKSEGKMGWVESKSLEKV